LTPQAHRVDCESQSAVETPPATGAPEIEITPEMIEAGGRAFRAALIDFEVGFGLSEMVAEEVLRAALRGEYKFTMKRT
jgi:hypothetical protein